MLYIYNPPRLCSNNPGIPRSGRSDISSTGSCPLPNWQLASHLQELSHAGEGFGQIPLIFGHQFTHLKSVPNRRKSWIGIWVFTIWDEVPLRCVSSWFMEVRNGGGFGFGFGIFRKLESWIFREALDRMEACFFRTCLMIQLDFWGFPTFCGWTRTHT